MEDDNEEAGRSHAESCENGGSYRIASRLMKDIASSASFSSWFDTASGKNTENQETAIENDFNSIFRSLLKNFQSLLSFFPPEWVANETDDKIEDERQELQQAGRIFKATRIPDDVKDDDKDDDQDTKFRDYRDEFFKYMRELEVSCTSRQPHSLSRAGQG